MPEPDRTQRLSQKLDSLPAEPGVYIMKDNHDRVIYVGKARVLKNRVRSYFQNTDRSGQPKLAAMIARINDFDYVVTRSEVEAFLLENNLIKHHRPRYNIMFRDDKSFPFIKLTNEPFPQILVTRRVTQDGARYFGPYTNAKAMRRLVDMVRRVFTLRTCPNARIWPSLARPCLDFYIHRCPAPCKNHISREEYETIVNQVCQFLSGHRGSVINQLKDRMEKAATALQFELAARVRDQIRTIENDAGRQYMVSMKPVDMDVINLFRDGEDIAFAVLQIREGKMIGREQFFMTGHPDDPPEETISAFLSAYYLTTRLFPQEIVLPAPPEDPDTLVEWLANQNNRRVTLTIPQRGEKMTLLKLAAQNAELQLGMRLLRKSQMQKAREISGPVAALQKTLRLENPPIRIEAFDISNVQGSDPVASMVLFVDGKPRKSDYRKFAIKDVAGPNDFAMMREVVGRRYARLLDEEKPLPDLILIDGGKGQLSSAKEILDELGLLDTPVVSLAKRLEEVFFPDQPEPLRIPRASPALKLLMSLRDEAHRFALTFHRQKRNTRMIRSELDAIPGIGPKRRQTILQAFPSVDHVRNCSLEELMAGEGITADVARRLYQHFHPESDDR